MKKSFIAMALMFGAVVFVASCGGGDDEKSDKCTVKIVVGNDKFPSAEYGEVEKSQAPTGNVVGADATAHKGGTYICE